MSRFIRALLVASALSMAVVSSSALAQAVNHDELAKLIGEPVTTSVTGKPQRASEAAASIVIITRDDIRRSPARDVPGLLQAYASIDVARWTADQSDVSIRGGVQPYNARLLVLVNGQQVYQDHFGLTNWQLLGVQLDDIQQIEVVRGPNSALFGFNAVSGVINIITINPLQTKQLAFTAEVGTRGYARGSASAAVKLGSDFGLRASAGYRRNNELRALEGPDFPPLARGAPFDPQHYEVSGELYGNIGTGTQVALSASHAFTKQQEFIHLLLTAKAHETFQAVGARLSHDTSWGVLSARIYRNHTDIRTPIDLLPAELEYHNTVLVASADALARLGTANTVRVGVEYRDNLLRDRPGYPGATTYKVFALNGMWESAISDAVTANVAARVDHLDLNKKGPVDQPTIFTAADFDRSFTTFSFNGALRVKLDEATTIRAAIARGVQSPSLFSFGSRLTLPIPGLPIQSVSAGDPSIRPAIIRSGELGLMHQWNDHGGRVEFTAFVNRTHNVIGSPAISTPAVAAPPAYPFILQTAQNVGSFTAWGFGASIADRIGEHLSWQINYSRIEARQNIMGETAGSFAWPIAFEQTTPENKVKGQVSYDNGPLLASIAARYISGTQQLISTSRSSLQLVEIEPSITIDAKLGLRFGAGTMIEVAGSNLTGASGAGLSPIAAERRLWMSLRQTF